MFFVYTIYNRARKKIYIGQTVNLEIRLKRHNGILLNNKKSFTAKNSGNWELIYKEEFGSRKEAEKREKELKSFRGREFIKNIIKKMNMRLYPPAGGLVEHIVSAYSSVW